MKTNTIILVIVVAILAGGGGYYAGTKMSSGSRGAFGGAGNGTFVTGRGQFAGNGQKGGMRLVSGQVISSDNQSITVKLPDGSTKIALLTGNTQITKSIQASITDLTTGIQVAVFGTPNSDGSVTAQNIQLNPQFERRGAQATPSSTP